MTSGELGNSLFAAPQVDIDLTSITSALDKLKVDFDTLKAEHAALGGTLTTISTKIDNLGSSFESADYLTASDIQPLFDTQYDEKLF